MDRYVKSNVEDWTKVGARVVQVDSTNDSLREQVQAFAKTGHVLPEGYSLRADYQSAGKGRLGRVWDANPGENLLVSYLLRSPGLRPDQLFLLLQNIAIAVRDTIEAFAFQQEVKVKWPNDILIDDKKVAGILIESMLMGDEISCIIVGIGINVNQAVFDDGVNATSLALSFGGSVSIEEVATTLTRKLQIAQEHLRSLTRTGDVYSLQQQYHSHLFGFREWLVFQDLKTKEELFGKVIGVLPSGELRLEQNGEERHYSLDDIRFIRKNDR
ncbi:MAG: biotin--[acetyl-CoA-carboxylase] ligase [Saprospiraceae bacterium]